MTAFKFPLILSIWCLSLTMPLFGQDRIVVDQYNDFGGKTFESSNRKDGILVFREFYAFDEKKMREETIFTDDHTAIFGIDQINSEFMFDVKVKREKIFSIRFAKVNLVKKSTDFYDQSSRLKLKTKNNFVEPYLGYNIIHYKPKSNLKPDEKFGLVKTKMEWHYPQNLEGLSKYIEFYSEDGEKKVRVENYYTQKSMRDNGIYKSVYYTEDKRRVKQEWYYTPQFSEKNKGVYKKIQNHTYYSMSRKKTSTYYYDQAGNVIFDQSIKY
ncbi:MAG: hypothetical protein OEY59_00075 [Deltaproteobacteria bacterium]|nr:hypothetical protein [Deltaproteobacteria bacterium]